MRTPDSLLFRIINHLDLDLSHELDAILGMVRIINLEDDGFQSAIFYNYDVLIESQYDRA